MGYVLIALGTAVLAIAVAVLLRGGLGSLRFANRRTAGIAMIIGVVVLSVGGVLAARDAAGTTAEDATAVARSARPSAPDTATASPGTTARTSRTTPAAGDSSTRAASGAARSRTWDALAACEASGDWAIDTGNGLYGGLQMDRRTWSRYGGQAYAPLPSTATREQQIAVAERVRADQGFSPWSSCARTLHLR